MTTATEKLHKKSLDSPDGSVTCGHGRMDQVELDGTTLSRMRMEPGWKWSEHVREMAQTETCQAHHLQYVISGRLQIVMDDGSRTELRPGDFVSIPPGHDAWVLGDEPFVAIDISPDLRQYTQGCAQGDS